MDDVVDEKGRKLVLIIAVFNLIMSAAYIVLTGIISHPMALLHLIVRFILFLILFHFLYRRAVWARWAVVILLVVSGLTDIAGVFALLMSGAFTLLAIIFGIAVIQLVSAGVLIFSPSVKAYFHVEK